MADGAGQGFPRDWRIAALYSEGEGMQKVKSPSDSEIAAADAIIVEYKARGTGTVVHRTIHGATSKDDVGSIIRNVTRVVSPPRKGRGK
jgi:hypothetical protein